jgi:hypothetical protein
MIKNLTSLLETAVVIGGLIAAPIVVLASSQSVAAMTGAATIVQDVPASGLHTAELKF